MGAPDCVLLRPLPPPFDPDPPGGPGRERRRPPPAASPPARRRDAVASHSFHLCLHCWFGSEQAVAEDRRGPARSEVNIFSIYNGSPQDESRADADAALSAFTAHHFSFPAVIGDPFCNRRHGRHSWPLSAPEELEAAAGVCGSKASSL